MNTTNNAIKILISVASVIAIGTIGYMLLAGLGVLDALYMTIITISTVGFMEVAPLSQAARLFTIFLIIAGLSVAAYGFSSIVSLFFEGEIQELIRRRKMQDKISKLNNHYILCGAGETGYSVISQFKRSEADFVVIEKDEEVCNSLASEGILIIQGDATQEKILHNANIDNAWGVISCLSRDTDNVYTVLTARQLNPDLHIVSRAINRGSHSKLKRAGANNTISPNELGGARMASLLLKPSVVSFLDVITQADEIMLDLEDVVICENSEFKNKQLKNANIKEKTGLMVIALKKKGDEDLIFNPSPEEVLEEGDQVLVLGKQKQINLLRNLACDAGVRKNINKREL